MEGIIIPSLNILRKPFYTQKVREITVQNNETFDLTQHPCQVILPSIPSNMIFLCDGNEIPYWVSDLVRGEIFITLDLPASGSKVVQMFYGGAKEFLDFQRYMPVDTQVFSCKRWTQAILDKYCSYTSVEPEPSGLLRTYGISGGRGAVYVKDLILSDVEVAIKYKVGTGWAAVRIREDHYWFKVSTGYFVKDEGTNLASFSYATIGYNRFRMVGSDLESSDELWGNVPASWSFVTSTTDSDYQNAGYVYLYSQEDDGNWAKWGEFLVRKATTNEPTVTVGAEKNVFRSW